MLAVDFGKPNNLQVHTPKRVVIRESYCFKYNSLSNIGLKCLHARIKSEVGWIETK